MGFQWILLFVYIFGLFLFERYFNRKSGSGFQITIPNYFFITLIAYTILPIFDCIINRRDTKLISPFLIKCIIIIICLYFGYFLGESYGFKSASSKKTAVYNLNKNQQRFWTIFWGAVVIGLLLVNIVFNRGGVENALSLSYRETFVAEGSNTIASLLYAQMPYAMIFNDKRLINVKDSRVIAFVISMITILLNFMMGNRNLAVMIFLALIWTFLREKKFNKLLVYGLLIAGVVFLGIIAVLREYSILLVMKGEVSIDWNLAREYAFSFSEGELGTTFAFERYRNQIVSGFQFPYRCGYSYLILPIINLIPSVLWSGKPMAYADYYSHYAFGEFDGLGYGFSPIYEAEINFGYIWWIVFIIVGIALARWSRIHKDNMSKYYNVGLAACIVLNFFRIDFTTYFKFYAMMWVFKWLYLHSFHIVIKKRENKVGIKYDNN